MSFNFAVKDLVHHKIHTKSYLLMSTASIALAVLFLNLIQSLGMLVIPSTIRIFNFTVIQLYAQYNQFTIILTVILAFFIIITNNHAFIQARKKDMAIMKAAGALPKILYSFYIWEIIIIVTTSLVIGSIIGYIAFYILYLILAAIFPFAQWSPNPIITLIITGGILLLTYLINGWEIRKIGRKTFGQTISGHIGENIKAKLHPFWQKILRNQAPSMKLAIRNIKRKKITFRENLALISIASMILFSSIIGVFFVNSSTQSTINDAQGNFIVAIGSTPILTSFSSGYEHFSNSSMPTLNTGNYLNIENNLTQFSSSLSTFIMSNDLTEQNWETRLYTIHKVQEELGYKVILQSDINETTFIEVGSNRSKIVTMQGVNFNYTVQHWNLNSSESTGIQGASIGDTLANELFEDVSAQKMSFINDDNETPIKFTKSITSVLVDPIYNGNSVYFTLEEMQHDFNLPNYTNLILIDYASLNTAEQRSDFLNNLQNLVNSELGNNFSIKDMHEIFNQNITSINGLRNVSLICSFLIATIIIFIVFYYQKARIDDDTHDITIVRAVGASKSQLQASIFYEKIGIILLGTTIGFIGALYFMLFFLMSNPVIPSIFVPLLVFLGILIIFSVISLRISTKTKFSYRSL
ncbi:MAG: FtsX-like permease family protein [Promethearchaeota archaeon]